MVKTGCSFRLFCGSFSGAVFISSSGWGVDRASIKLLEQVGNQYRQANNYANECSPVLKHDFPTPKKLMTILVLFRHREPLSAARL